MTDELTDRLVTVLLGHAEVQVSEQRTPKAHREGGARLDLGNIVLPKVELWVETWWCVPG